MNSKKPEKRKVYQMIVSIIMTVPFLFNTFLIDIGWSYNDELREINLQETKGESVLFHKYFMTPREESEVMLEILYELLGDSSFATIQASQSYLGTNQLFSDHLNRTSPLNSSEDAYAEVRRYCDLFRLDPRIEVRVNSLHRLGELRIASDEVMQVVKTAIESHEVQIREAAFQAITIFSVTCDVMDEIMDTLIDALNSEYLESSIDAARALDMFSDRFAKRLGMRSKVYNAVAALSRNLYRKDVPCDKPLYQFIELLPILRDNTKQELYRILTCKTYKDLRVNLRIRDIGIAFVEGKCDPSKILPFLGDEDDSVRYSAGLLLSTYKHDIIPLLIKTADSENPKKCIAAISIIDDMQCFDRRTLPVLFRKTKDTNAKVRLAAIRALSKRDVATRKSISVFKRAVKDKNSDVRRAARAILIRLGEALPEPEDDLTALVERLNNIDLDSDARILAAEQLGRKGDAREDVITALKTSITDDEDPRVCQTSVDSLVMLAANSEQAQSAVIQLLGINLEEQGVERDNIRGRKISLLDALCESEMPRFVPFSTLRNIIDNFEENEEISLTSTTIKAMGKIITRSDEDKVVGYIYEFAELSGMDADWYFAEDIQRAAKEALVSIGGPEVARKLISNLIGFSSNCLKTSEDGVYDEEFWTDSIDADYAEQTICEDICDMLQRIGPDAYTAIPGLLEYGLDCPPINSRADTALAAIGHNLNPAYGLQILGDLAKLKDHPNPDVQFEALEYLNSIMSKVEEGLTDDHWKQILIDKNRTITLLFIYENHRELFDSYARNIPWLDTVKRLFDQMQTEINNYPPDAQADFRRRICMSIDDYIETCVSKKNEYTISSEYVKIYSFLKIVHDNLPACLDSFTALNISAADFESLRKTLPFNNSLTRIIRMLGERSHAGGFVTVTERVKKAGRFSNLYDIIVDIASRRKTAAPQEIAGLLEVLSHIEDFSVLEDSFWSDLKGQIERYYESGNKVITYQLFKYFVDHENDPEAIRTMRADIDNEISSIAWGEFMGLSDQFKDKYGLGVEDELALLAKYMLIANLTTRDYAGKCEDIKQALRKRGSAWKEEVDPDMRGLYALRGTVSQLIYSPEEKDAMNREIRSKLHRELCKYLRDTKGERDPIEVIEGFILGLEGFTVDDARKAAIAITIQNSQIDHTYYTSIPNNEEDLHAWLSAWHTLVTDSFKHDASTKVGQIVRGAVEKASEEDLVQLLESHRVPDFQTITVDRNLFKIDDKIAAALVATVLAGNEEAREVKKENFANIFKNKWMVLLTNEVVRDKTLITSWVDNGLQKAANRLFKLAKKRSPDLNINLENIASLLREAILRARELQEVEIENQTDLDRRRVMLADRISRDILTLFSNEISQIQKELKGFKAIEREAATRFYTGFFDDLLHLMGFMMSGVCTWTERDKQILDQNCHFGKLALKDENGRILGLSQVQLLHCGISGEARSVSSKGWRVIALPGINLSEGNIGMNKERALLSILETAQRYSELLGMEGAVIPVSKEIHSNHGFEKQFIQTLVRRGWLKEATLAESVILTRDTYAYKYADVYLITIPQKDMFLAPVSREEMVRQEKLAAERLEREKAASFSNGLGEILYDRDTSEAIVTSVKEAVEDIVENMPRTVVENIKLNASIKGVSFKVRIEPDQERSVVNKARAEIEITLGKDILYKDNKIEIVQLIGILSELFAAFILEDYASLKENLSINENAYFKLELIKILLGYKRYLHKYHMNVCKYNWNETTYPSEMDLHEKQQLLHQYNADLDRFTDGMRNISQWNIFLNVMDDADPAFMITNYIHILLRQYPITDEDIDTFIANIAKVDIGDKPSLARIRNLFKDFVLFGTAHLAIGDESQAKDAFTHFDSTPMMLEAKEILLTTRDEAQFYSAFRKMLEMGLVLPEHSVNDEVSRFLDKDIVSLAPDQREEPIREAVKEILTRRIGSHAFSNLESHLKAQRGLENIPYINISARDDVAEGLDIDDFGFLEYTSEDGIDYSLVFSGTEEAESHDWIHNLFIMGSDAKSSPLAMKDKHPALIPINGIHNQLIMHKRRVNDI